MKKRLFPLTASGGGGGSKPKLITKTVTQNGEYRAESEQADGYSTVTVAVPEKVLTTKTITTNGAYAASEDNADGYSSLTVSVLPNLGTKTITTNGAYAANEDSLDGYSSLTVSVQPSLGTKTITTNGTYAAQDDNLDGYSRVTVNYDTSPKFKVEYIDMDGELFEPVQEVAAGGQAIEPNEIPYFDTDYLEFVEWKASADTTNVQEDIFCLPLYRTLYDEATQQRPTYLMCYFEASYLSPTFVFGSYNTTNFVNAYIDFGDGTSAQAIDSSSISHTYENAGTYVVKVWGDKYIIGGSSTAGLFSSADYNRCLYKAYLGENSKIGENSFRNCYALTYFVSPLTFWGQMPTYSRTFASSSLSITICPQGTLSSYCFDNSRVKFVLLPNNITNIGSYCFQSCSFLEKINLSNITYFGSFAFKGAGLQEFTTAKATSVESGVFDTNNKLRKVIVTATTTSISFGTLPALEEIVFETRTQDLAFYGLTSMLGLKNLILPDTAITTNAISVAGSTGLCLQNLYLPSGFYTNIVNGWFSKNITIGNGYNHDLHVQGCNCISILNIAKALADLTGETTQTLKLSSYYGHKAFINATYVDANGNVVPAGTAGATTLLDYITNKNWTVTFS